MPNMCQLLCHVWQASLVAQAVKNLPAIQESWVPFLVGKIPWKRAQEPTPVFLFGESHRQRSLAGTVHGVAQTWTRLKQLSKHVHAMFKVMKNETLCYIFYLQVRFIPLSVQFPLQPFYLCFGMISVFGLKLSVMLVLIQVPLFGSMHPSHW